MSDPNATIDTSNRKITMTTPFDTQIAILTDIQTVNDITGEYSDFVGWHDLTFAYILGLQSGHIILTTAGEELISGSFSNFLKDYDLEDTGFQSLTDIVGEDE